jgi:hypothetical protein
MNGNSLIVGTLATILAIASWATYTTAQRNLSRANTPPVPAVQALVSETQDQMPLLTAELTAELTADNNAAFIGLGPAQPPFSPTGWIVTLNNGSGWSTSIPRLLTYRTVQNASGTLDMVLTDIVQDGFGGQMPGMAGQTPYISNQFTSSVFPQSWIKVIPNGPSEVHYPGGSAFGTGPTNPLATFTLSGSAYSVTITPIP